jgi:uncharacterized protein (DUF2267 family)
MNHDEFVGQVQHRAHLPSRGDADSIIRATLETLGERLQKESAAHVAAQLPPEIGRHLKGADHFEHLSLHDFYERVAERENSEFEKAVFHARAVLDTLLEAITPGAVRKLKQQMPAEFQELLLHPTV